jgi:hypothetical protein
MGRDHVEEETRLHAMDHVLGRPLKKRQELSQKKKKKKPDCESPFPPRLVRLAELEKTDCYLYGKHIS